MASLDSRLWYTEPGSVCRGAVGRTRDRDTLNPDPHTAGANFPQSTAARAFECAGLCVSRVVHARALHDFSSLFTYCQALVADAPLAGG